eukprot:491853-Amphidinium_carterae.1
MVIPHHGVRFIDAAVDLYRTWEKRRDCPIISLGSNPIVAHAQSDTLHALMQVSSTMLHGLASPRPRQRSELTLIDLKSPLEREVPYKAGFERWMHHMENVAEIASDLS